MVVRIDSWESTSLYPNGHSVRVLGRAGELETEIQTILIENAIHVAPFSDAQVRDRPERTDIHLLSPMTDSLSHSLH